MVTIFRAGYILLLSYNPCDVFNYFDVKEMHGLSLVECEAHPNDMDSAYIAGWCNFVPKESGQYAEGDRRFIFINLTRCADDIAAMGLIMHEMMHQSLYMHDYDIINKEEEIITWAEKEAYKVFDLVKPMKSKIVRQAITVKSE